MQWYDTKKVKIKKIITELLCIGKIMTLDLELVFGATHFHCVSFSSCFLYNTCIHTSFTCCTCESISLKGIKTYAGKVTAVL